MALTLSIVNVDKLENGVATRLRLDRHGAVIGRSPHVDWSLPDPNKHISSTHCEIGYRDGAYTLVDKSTNGTFVNGGQERVQGPHRIADGDVIMVGHYQISARLEGADASSGAPAAPQAPAWGGWDSHAGGGPAPAAAPASDWAKPAPQAAISGMGPMSQNWAPPRVDAPAAPAAASGSNWAEPAPGSSTWGAPAAPAASAPSGWSSPAGEAPAAASAADVWGQLAAGNVVDWARGFSAPAPSVDPLAAAPARSADPFGLASPAASDASTLGAAATVAPAPPAGGGWASPAAPQPATMPPQSAPPSAPPPAPAAPAPIGTGDLTAFLAAAGLQPSDLALPPAEALTAIGLVIRRLVGGVVVMLEARARAKAQLGAQGTALEFAGNNPLKFARTPEQALAQLLNPPQRGFMPADRAIEDSFQDLQAHQMATLAAMQGALRTTLARFSPEAIRNRAETGGLMAKIMPGAKDAALWHAYEREFEGVARGSDEAFMDVFAREFRQAYEKVSAEMKRQP